MPSMMTKFFLVLAGLLIVSHGASALPTAGKSAPDFVLKDTAGRNIRLSELRGEVVLINFWATWCAPCRQELPLLEKIQQQYRTTGFRLLTINLDENANSADNLLKKLGVTLPTLYDPNKNVAKLYDVDAMPATLIIDREGRVRHVHRGYRNGYEQKYEQQVRELLKQ